MTEVTAATQHAGPGSVLRSNRGFRVLLRGSSVSMLGSRVSTLAFPLLVLALTGSPIVAGWACFAATMPSFLFYLPAGALVDRAEDPRRAMLFSEIARGVAVALIVVMILTHQSVVALTVLAAVEEILEVFSVLAERRFVRALVKPDQVASALASSEGRTHMVVLVGRPLGGFLFGVWRILPFSFDVASFFVSVGSLLYVKNEPRYTAAEPVASRNLATEISDGFRWLRQYRFAGLALPLTAGATFIGQALIMVFLAEAHLRHLSPFYTGVVLAASGAGGAAASVAGWRLPPWRSHSPLKIQMLIWAAALLILALLGGESIIALAVTMAILGFTGALGNIAVDTYVIQNTAEKNTLARVMSVSRMASFGALALGPLFGGVLVARGGPQHAVFALFSVTMLLFAVAVTALPSAAQMVSGGGEGLRGQPRTRMRRSPALTRASMAQPPCHVRVLAQTGDHDD